jgi:hypothetical protein
MQTTLKIQFTVDLQWLAVLLTGCRDQSTNPGVGTAPELHSDQRSFATWMDIGGSQGWTSKTAHRFVISTEIQYA